jgi:hypothetical protein
VFHVSQLRRCLRVPETEHVPVEAIDLQPDLRYQEVPVKILDTVTKRTRNSEVRICRVQWSRHGVEATWEREDALKKEFPHLFRNQPNLEDEIHFKWGRFVTSRKFTQINYSLKMFFKIFSSLSSNLFWRFSILAPKLNFRSNTKHQISVPTLKSIII